MKMGAIDIDKMADIFVGALGAEKVALGELGEEAFGPFAWVAAAEAAIQRREAQRLAKEAAILAFLDRRDIRSGILLGGIHRRPFTTWTNGGGAEPSFKVLWVPAPGAWLRCTDHDGFESELCSDQEALEEFDRDGAACPFTIG